MGVAVHEPHDPRPTGKLFAPRWKHEHARLALIGIILSFAITVLFLTLFSKADAKNVTIVDGGVASVIRTGTGSVAELLEEQQIYVGPHDRVSLLLTDPLEDGGQIFIDRAMPITVKADGKEELKYTTEDTVAGAMKALNLKLEGEDRVSPPPNSPLKSGMSLTITRVRTHIVETEQPIAFKVVEQKNEYLEAGKQKVVKTGKEGVVVYKTKKVYENGKLVSKELVGKTVAQPAVQQIVAIGTKKKPAVTTLAYNGKPSAGEARVVNLNGKTVNVKRMLNNVTLTAYSAGFASTGKSKGDEGYGVTASGAIVQEGRTIAVDPKVIPIGWWVYIEGVGFRRAEDTGSAVKGKKIDMYYDSEKTANRFGTKRGYTVYVIGPVKPSAD